jgi:hypothetical protein
MNRLFFRHLLRPVGLLLALLSLGVGLGGCRTLYTDLEKQVGGFSALTNVSIFNGFFIDQQGHVLTVSHGLRDECRSVWLVTTKGRAVQVQPDDILHRDRFADLALLRSGLSDTRPLSLATGSERPVAVHGFRPEDWAQAPRREPVLDSKITLMSLKTGRRRDQVLVLPTRVAPGVSGSAVLDGGDRLVGMIIRGQADILSGQTESDIGLMLPPLAIREFLAKAAIMPVRTEHVSGDLADSAVQVICVRPDRTTPPP